MQKNNNVYDKLGASATKDEVHAAITKQDKGVVPGAFCKFIPDPCCDNDYCAAMHADGAGTKSSLAYITYKETGDTRALFNIATDSIVMNLDDLICAGATGGFVMSNTIGRNAHRVDGTAIAAVIAGYENFVEKMNGFGIDITMSGGETADVGDLVSTLIVDSTFFVRMKKRDVIDCEKIAAGDVIVALSSFGQASYETSYNAGMGSNGLTAARHLLLSNLYADKYPESFSHSLSKSDAYTGKYLITDQLNGAPVTVGDAILSPTRTYAPIIKDAFDGFRDKIHGIIHCTGGAQAKCLGFGKNLHYVKNNLFEMPPLFRAIAETGTITRKEMYRVFNMGQRMELYCDAMTADEIIKIAGKYNVEAKIVGCVEAGDEGKNTLTITDKDGEYTYEK